MNSTISYFKFLFVMMGVTLCCVIVFSVLGSMNFGFGTQFVSAVCGLLALLIYYELSRDSGAQMSNYEFFESPFPEILIGFFFAIVIIVWGCVVETFSYALHYDFSFWKYVLRAGISVILSGTTGYMVGYLAKNEDRLLFA